MLAEIVLLRLETALRAAQETTPFTRSRFIPICAGMLFKRRRAP